MARRSAARQADAIGDAGPLARTGTRPLYTPPACVSGRGLALLDLKLGGSSSSTPGTQRLSPASEVNHDEIECRQAEWQTPFDRSKMYMIGRMLIQAHLAQSLA